MKKLFTSLLLFAILIYANYATAQIVSLEEVHKIKNSKMIVGLTKDADLNQALKTAVENFWNFSEVVEYLPIDEAYKKVKNTPNLVVLSIGTTKSNSLSHGKGMNRYKFVSKGNHIEISTGKRAVLVKNYIPAFGKENIITDEIIAFGISSLQYMCQTMDQQNIKSNLKLKSAYKVHSPKLKTKKLYVMEGWLSDKIQADEVESIYDFPVEVVSYEKWENAILSKKEGVAYSIIVPVPVGGDYVYQHYLVDAQTGMIYGISQPKAAMKVAGFNVSKSNTGYINKANLENYSDVVNGKW